MEQFSLLHPQNSKAEYMELTKEAQNDLSIAVDGNAIIDIILKIDLQGEKR